MLDVAVVGLGWWGRIIVSLLAGSRRLRVVRAAEPQPGAAALRDLQRRAVAGALQALGQIREGARHRGADVAIEHGRGGALVFPPIVLSVPPAPNGQVR